MSKATAYDFSAAPQSVPLKRDGGNKSKYRQSSPEPVDENVISTGNNIMFDARVVRGNTYAAQVVTQEQQRVAAVYERNENARSRKMTKARDAERARRGRTPEPVDGRRHQDAQTEAFLEELNDRPVEKAEGTQTEAFLDRPPSPLFVPGKNGVDMETQILVGELFDFDLEVGPILDVLVGKTLEVSMLELMEEEELAAIRKQQEKFELMRNAELSEVQRLEYEAKRKFAEKQRRKKQEREYKEAQEELREKVAARAFAKAYLSDLHASVFDGLESAGHFYCPVKREVETVFLPWLMADVGKSLDAVAGAYKAVEHILEKTLEEAKKIRDEAVAKEQARLAAIEAEKKAAEEARLAAIEAARLKAEAEAAGDGAPAVEE